MLIFENIFLKLEARNFLTFYGISTFSKSMMKSFSYPRNVKFIEQKNKTAKNVLKKKGQSLNYYHTNIPLPFSPHSTLQPDNPCF
jgi:hypothetical protein